ASACSPPPVLVRLRLDELGVSRLGFDRLARELIAELGFQRLELLHGFFELFLPDQCIDQREMRSREIRLDANALTRALRSLFPLLRKHVDVRAQHARHPVLADTLLDLLYRIETT